MLYLATHIHPPERCPSSAPDLVKIYQKIPNEEWAKKNGCKIIFAVLIPMDHLGYILFEANDHDSMMRFLRPLLKMGSTKITPVREWKYVPDSMWLNSTS